jgi:uncharacterized protein YijF (DUF1287 family)
MLLFLLSVLAYTVATAVATGIGARATNLRAAWVDRFVAEYKPNGRARSLAPASCTAVIARARSLVTPAIRYDPSYVGMTFPDGDVPPDRGVCADVIVRAFRSDHRDLQALVNRDMRQDFARYPHIWGLGGPDTNIDHRRVPNLMTWFTRHGAVLPLSRNPGDYQPCDIVAWDLGNGVTHIGLVSDRVTGGEPALIHHIGGHPEEENVLLAWRLIGHFAF